MGVVVYSRLGDLLRARHLTVDDLQRQIATRFGLAVDTRTLDRMTRADRVRRPDLELAAAAAEALDVSLNDVFAVETAPANDGSSPTDGLVDEEAIFNPAQNRRLRTLFDLQEQRPLREGEHAEMRALVAEYGRREYEQGVRSIAAKRGLPVDVVRAEVTADLEREIAIRRDLEADPARLESLIEEFRERQRTRSSH